MISVAERILRGRDAESRFNDPVLNKAFDTVVDKWLRAIISATPAESEHVIEAKRRIDAIQDARRVLKTWIEDGELAQAEEENQ